MSNKIDYDEEIRQRFAMLHLAWDEAHWQRKKDPTVELRKYLHILGGISATWQGILNSKHYHRISPRFELDTRLTTSLCKCICDILINTHPKYRIPESLASEIQELAIELLELHVLADASPSKFIIQSFENVIHILNMKSVGGWEVAQRAVENYSKMVDHEVLGDEFQSLVDLIGPSVAYAEYTQSEDFDSVPEYWANDLYRDQVIDVFDHMSCELCWSPGSPEVIANEEIRAQKERKKK